MENQTPELDTHNNRWFIVLLSSNTENGKPNDTSVGYTGLPTCVVFEEMVGGAGCVRGQGKRVDGVFPGRPQSFRHQRRPVDDCSPGERGWRRTAEEGAEHFMAKWIVGEKAKAGLRHAVVYLNVRVFQGLGGGGDTTIPSPGMVRKQPLPGIGLHESVHGSASLPRIRFISPGGWSSKFPGGALFVPSPPKTGTNLLHPRPPPQLLNDS